jgi:hypothetical protein
MSGKGIVNADFTSYADLLILWFVSVLDSEDKNVNH